MGGSFYLFSGIIYVAIAAILIFATISFFRRYKKLNDVLKNESELSGRAEGSISAVEEVRHRNRSFRWVNEYPVITYTANGKLYNVNLDYAEKRSGHYSLGGSYTVRFNPSDPSSCFVEEFRKQMKSYRTQALVVTIIFGFFSCNLIISAINLIIQVLTGSL